MSNLSGVISGLLLDTRVPLVVVFLSVPLESYVGDSFRVLLRVKRSITLSGLETSFVSAGVLCPVSIAVTVFWGDAGATSKLTTGTTVQLLEKTDEPPFSNLAKNRFNSVVGLDSSSILLNSSLV